MSLPEHLQERTAAIAAWAPGPAHLSSGEDCAPAARDPQPRAADATARQSLRP